MKNKTHSTHDFGDAGYICLVCSVVKGTAKAETACTGPGLKGYDVWLYHVGVGWWIERRAVRDAQEAANILSCKINVANCVAGAIVPTGNPFGAFVQG